MLVFWVVGEAIVVGKRLGEMLLGRSIVCIDTSKGYVFAHPRQESEVTRKGVKLNAHDLVVQKRVSVDPQNDGSMWPNIVLPSMKSSTTRLGS